MQNDVAHGDAAQWGSPRWQTILGRLGIYEADQCLFLTEHKVGELHAPKHEQNSRENGLQALCLPVPREAG